VNAARLWLVEGYTTREKTAQLRRMVAKTRGQEYADQLLEEMRAQWRSRSQWMGEQPTGPPA